MTTSVVGSSDSVGIGAGAISVWWVVSNVSRMPANALRLVLDMAALEEARR